MINIIVGHRGTGKSHWLKTISHIYKGAALCFDLDKEVEAFSEKTIASIFEKEGEKGFRKWEQKVFQHLLKNIRQTLRTSSTDKKIFIAVGAGFVFKKTKDMKVIYLGRITDPGGRVFLDRPRLTGQKSSPFEEYLNLYKKRESYYLKQADEVFFRMEYFKKAQPSDRVFLGVKKNSKPIFILRLNPETMPTDSRLWKDFLIKKMDWGIKFFELHDKTTNFNFVKRIRNFIPEEKILFSSQEGKSFQKIYRLGLSFEAGLLHLPPEDRTPAKAGIQLNPQNSNPIGIKNKINWSWDLSLGKPPTGVQIVSLHQRGKKNLKKILKDFSTYKNCSLKLAVEIFTLQELWEGLMWQRQNPKHRSFLPRSPDGRWRWFRNAFPMPLHFIREGKSDVLDQPFFAEACHYQKKARALAGVLGNPVHFSATPAEHNDFLYRKRSVPVLSIPLEEQEMTKKNLELFQKMGLVFFAVTSPLKKRAFRYADVLDKEAKKLKSVNLLIYHRGKWRGYNTDGEGLKFLKKDKNKNVVVWGGGGIRNAIKKQLPQAHFYSARRGVPLSSKPAKGVDVLVWAVGRSRMEQGCLWPPKEWSPSLVKDLNYMEDSPGREYAIKTGAAYESGWAFFKAQAAKQREIFLKLNKEK